MCLVLIAVDESETTYNLDGLYNCWRRYKPSRSAYLNLIKDLEHLGWISKVKGVKKSERRLIINAKAIRSALFIDPNITFTDGWLFTTGFIDFKD